MMSHLMAGRWKFFAINRSVESKVLTCNLGEDDCDQRPRKYADASEGKETRREKYQGWQMWTWKTIHPTTRIPNSSPSARPSQQPSHGNISGTKRGIIDPLVSKRPEANYELKNQKYRKIEIRKKENMGEILTPRIRDSYYSCCVTEKSMANTLSNG